ncbi:MAG: type II toxin-antitoxin system RelE/ParE family toxin [Candidatus Tectomicrobia bacterium]|uniref:Type II toxin-antitoxin system RelE/ParE family toxin n=1 Tax=Tectimicrobiota bacterium TaxID=2528274 RepID=A0A938B1Q0_UNCTE|nr:type II toxin-antitoxin system RelE/ParE family toxin [Candidatus Tectomicrobia bacterium]
MVRRIRTSVLRLEDFPQSGRVVPELPEGPYCALLVGPCRVVYRYVEAQPHNSTPTPTFLSRK